MTKDEFLSYASRAWDDAQTPVELAPFLMRWHKGYNLPDGSRVYFEYRRARL